MPGERYTVTVDKGAFHDLVGNSYAGHTESSGHFFITNAKVVFTKIPNFFSTGARYGASAAVDTSNNIMVAGGFDALRTLDEALIFRTFRETNCFQADNAPGFYACDGGASSKSCYKDPKGGTKLVLGEVSREVRVYRPSSRFGLPCTNRQGVSLNGVGDVTKRYKEVCDCPWCMTPPGPVSSLSPNMSNTTYVNSYAPVQANDSTRPLHCAEGYMPIGSFQCRRTSWFIGNFKQPHPQCKPGDCTAPPNTSAVPFFNSYFMPSNTSKNCGLLSGSNYLAHDARCGLRCNAGYRRQVGASEFRCRYGRFQRFGSFSASDFFWPVCEPQSCSTIDLISQGFGATVKCGSGSMYVGEKCSLFCNAGYKGISATAAPDVPCLADASLGPESAPQFPKPILPNIATICQASACLKNLVATGATIIYNGLSLRQTASVTCIAGSMNNVVGTKLTFTLTCSPKVKQLSHPEVEWQDSSGANVTQPCQKTNCASPSTSHGRYKPMTPDTCMAGVTQCWELLCDDRYFLTGGKSVASCKQDGIVSKPSRCEFGGCNGSMGTAMNKTTDCAAIVNETQTCTRVCPKTEKPVGYYTCLAGNLTGWPLCIDKNTPSDSTVKKYMLKGTFQVCVKPSFQTPLPGVLSDMFKSDVKQALAGAMGVSVTDFPDFIIALANDPTCTMNRRLGDTINENGVVGWQPRLKGRRLDLVAQSAKIDYTVQVRDAAHQKSLAKLIDTMAEPGNTLTTAFTTALAKKDYAVAKVAVITPAKEFTVVQLVGDCSTANPECCTPGSCAPAPVPAPPAADTGLAGGAIAAIIVVVLLLTCCCCTVAAKLITRKGGG